MQTFLKLKNIFDLSNCWFNFAINSLTCSILSCSGNFSPNLKNIVFSHLFANFPQFHVLFDSNHFILELGSSGTHVRDHTADITDDCSENQNTAHEIESDEEELNVSHRAWYLIGHFEEKNKKECFPMTGLN